MVSTIAVTDLCNQNCVYCAAAGRGCQTKKEVEEIILNEKDFIIFTGGEPTMSKEIEHYLHLAEKTGARVEFQSNGTTLSYRRLAEKLTGFGINLFNIAMPSHMPNLSDKITQTSGLFGKRIEGIKNLLGLGAKVRITEVINSLNYKYLKDYSEFINNQLKGVSFIEFNYIKGDGKAKNRKDLIPRYAEVAPYLLSALAYCTANNLRFVVDHIPICYLGGFEQFHADIEKIIRRVNQKYSYEKNKVSKCEKCSLSSLCFGPRKDYVEMYGEDVLPSNKNPEEIRREYAKIIC